MTTLLLSSRHTEDNQALWRAALHAGWTIEGEVNSICRVGLLDNHKKTFGNLIDMEIHYT